MQESAAGETLTQPSILQGLGIFSTLRVKAKLLGLPQFALALPLTRLLELFQLWSVLQWPAVIDFVIAKDKDEISELSEEMRSRSSRSSRVSVS